jgi:hypothetical protein
VTISGDADAYGYIDGSMSTARWFGPRGLAFDNTGNNLYIIFPIYLSHVTWI